MKDLVWVAVLAAVALGLVTWLKQRSRRETSGEIAKAKAPLTEREQPMYFRLKETFPEHVVLAQVAFSALLIARTKSCRNTFDRKVADFVLCSKSFTVIAVIELDDSSHKGRDREDNARDALLKGAGYRVLRFKSLPNAAMLKEAITR